MVAVRKVHKHPSHEWLGAVFPRRQGNIYEKLAGWPRLRCILRRRAGRKDRGRPDHRTYTNAYFAELGLISLTASAWVKRANPA
jgi:hypothetical protein